MLNWLFTMERRRQRMLRQAQPGPLHDYLAVPLPERTADWRRVDFVALDLETTGLDPARDEILSVGMVELQGGCIRLGSARHYLVAPDRAVPERSAVIHQLTDDQLATGRPLGEVLPEVLDRLAGRVLLCHHAAVETGFFDAACRRLYGAAFVALVADTEWLIGRWLVQRNQPLAPGALRLHALRERFNLPRYKAHDALVDALATAELFCAFAAHRELGSDPSLRHFLSIA